MKFGIGSLLVLSGIIFSGFLATSAFCSQEKNTSFLFPDETSKSSIALSDARADIADRTSRRPERDTLIHLKAGQTDFHEASFANDYSNFHYGYARGNSFALGAQYNAIRGLGLWGAYFELGMTYFSGELQSQGSDRQQTRLTLVPVSVGVVYTADLHRAMRYFLPSVSLGVTQNFYLHNGTEDQLRARGNYSSLRTAFAFRHSLDWVGFDNLSLLGEYSSSRATANNVSTMMVGLTSEL